MKLITAETLPEHDFSQENVENLSSMTIVRPLAPGKPRIPDLQIPRVKSEATFSETSDDRGGSEFFTKLAILPDINQNHYREGYAVRSLTKIACKMTVLKDKDEDWDDFNGYGQCTVGFRYHLHEKWRTVRFNGFIATLFIEGGAPYRSEPFRPTKRMRRGNTYEIIHRFSVSSIEYMEPVGMRVTALEGLVHI